MPSSTTPPEWQLTCPSCGTPLARQADDLLTCPQENLSFPRRDGIWRCLLPETEERWRLFAEQYATVRRDEGWGMDDPAYYRALPFADLSGRHREIWRLRAVHYQLFARRVLAPLATARQRSLRILDLGAGNGWLSERLCGLGHQVAAVDLSIDPVDGLGAHVHFRHLRQPGPVLLVQAAFERLPWADHQVDLVIFNGSLHYTPSYAEALKEALRVLVVDGQLVIMDSPTYRDASSGAQMVAERREAFRRRYGHDQDAMDQEAMDQEAFLTFSRIDQLGQELGIAWRLFRPFHGWRHLLRPWKARLLGRREPASFPILVGQRQKDGAHRRSDRPITDDHSSS